jgi:uncharacterized protein with GYD domain
MRKRRAMAVRVPGASLATAECDRTRAEVATACTGDGRVVQGVYFAGSRVDAISRRAAVSLYVMLSSLSESGRKVLRERPGWIKKVNADVQRMGARVVAQYAVLGPYDFVTIVEAPDNATISRVSVELGARGGSAGMTMAAIPLDEFIERLERGGRRQGKKKR